MRDCLLIYSGGLDSTSALHIYRDRIKLAVSFNYGSKHNAMEIKYAKLNCERLGIEHRVINLKQVFSNIHSALLDEREDIPDGHYAEDNMAKTVVPFRNGIMLSIAAGIADSEGLGTIMLASHKGDNAQYPDCTPAFNSGMEQAVYYGTKHNVKLAAPFETVDKREIAVAGVKAGMLPEQTYSCYKGGLVHCGRCGTCVERIWALKDLEDNTEYADKEYAIKLLKVRKEW